ncbi:hypothetical protein V1291_003440 [Nitrobacteraceae bacterium AZCC 1564]
MAMRGSYSFHAESSPAYCPPPPAVRELSYPSWKVIVSASRGQKLNKPGFRPGFFLSHLCMRVT